MEEDFSIDIDLHLSWRRWSIGRGKSFSWDKRFLLMRVMYIMCFKKAQRVKHSWVLKILVLFIFLGLTILYQVLFIKILILVLLCWRTIWIIVEDKSLKKAGWKRFIYLFILEQQDERDWLDIQRIEAKKSEFGDEFSVGNITQGNNGKILRTT